MTELPPLPSSSPVTRRGVSWLQLLLVAALTFAVFTPVLRTPFAPLDDYLMLGTNPDIIKPSWPAFKSFWTQSSFRIYMPLALSVWQAIAVLTQSPGNDPNLLVMTPFAFKLVSVSTQALSGMAAAWTLSVLTRTRWPAVIGGLLFSIHPLQVESVAWTTGLKDQMCGLFSILTIGLYARHAARDPASPWRDWSWWLAFVTALLAMASKPTAMVLPVTLLAVDWAMRQYAGARRFVSVVPFLLPAIACALIIVTIQGDSTADRVPLFLRPFIAGDTYAFYLGKVIWPAHMAVDYGRRPSVVRQSAMVWVAWVVPLIALAGVLLMRSRLAVLAAVLFVVPVLPVSGLASFDMQQYSTVTDHYMYQPMLGVALLVALLLVRWPTPVNEALGMVMVVALVMLAGTTRHVAKKWQDPEGFYRDILRINPQSFMARDLLCSAAIGRGDFVTARRLVEESLRFKPGNGGALFNRSTIEMNLGHYKEAAEAGTKAIDSGTVNEVSLGRRITLLGMHFKDIDLAEKGLRYWRRLEKDNAYVTTMLRTVQKAKAAEAATRPAGDAAPRPQLPAPAARP